MHETLARSNGVVVALKNDVGAHSFRAHDNSAFVYFGSVLVSLLCFFCLGSVCLFLCLGFWFFVSVSLFGVFVLVFAHISVSVFICPCSLVLRCCSLFVFVFLLFCFRLFGFLLVLIGLALVSVGLV